MKLRRRNRAFTLVEILIVVVILGILAAVVVPQFVNASDQAQAGNVQTQLQTLRTQIALYRASENEFPALATLWDDLIAEDLIDDPPLNPRNQSDTVTAGADGADDGWIYNEETGELWCNLFNEDFRDPDDTGEGDPWADNWDDGVDFGDSGGGGGGGGTP